MIEDAIQYVLNGLLWLLLSEEGREWMPFIMFIGGIWLASLVIWVWWPDKED